MNGIKLRVNNPKCPVATAKENPYDELNKKLDPREREVTNRRRKSCFGTSNLASEEKDGRASTLHIGSGW